MVMNNCLTSKTNAFVSAMQLARSTAITFRDDVGVGALDCRLDEGDDDAADGTCNNADEFGEGLVVYRDIDNDGFADPNVEDIDGDGVLDAGEDLNGNGVLDVEIIKRVRFNCPASMNETTDGVGGNDSIDNSTVFIYEPNGAATPRATIEVCDDRDSSDYVGRRILLSATGRPTTETTFPCP
jgi:type IV fimbrial biogenesis protein FimT